VFKSEGARLAFEKALFEACERSRWVLHAYVIMGNHFHLAVETPKGNLSEGMRWLQCVFANRFNRLRKENGRLFQGRFKSLYVEDLDRLGWLCHYIHLNPVRAGVCSAEELKDYRWASSWYWRRARERPKFLDFRACLDAAGGLVDSASGWKRYERYLRWLSTDEPEQKRLEFEKMSRGWALGTRGFKKALVQEQNRDRRHLRLERREAQEARELEWEERLERCLKVLKKNGAFADADPKSADWKVAIAAHLKNRLLCSNGWLAENLNMGAPFAVSRYVGELRDGKRPRAEELYGRLTAKIT
jgi:REP element-mobilizing transposase RayT